MNGSGMIMQIDLETRRESLLILKVLLLDIFSNSELVFRWSLWLSVSMDPTLSVVINTGDLERDLDFTMANSASCMACKVSIALQI